MTTVALGPSSTRTTVLRRRVRLIVAATISYNVVEAVVAVTAGTIASSTALIGFGLDSTIEVTAAVAVAWQFNRTDHREREATTLRIVGFSFLALAAYVGFESIRTLLSGADADHSAVGIALAASSLLVMPGLSLLERRTGRELGSASVVANSKQTLICSYLSAVLLAGLVLNSTLGWAWADPAAALVIAAMAAREGRNALRGEACCTPAAVDDPAVSTCHDGCCAPA